MKASIHTKPPRQRTARSEKPAGFRKAGIYVFGFFLLKGLVWLSVPLWIWLGIA